MLKFIERILYTIMPREYKYKRELKKIRKRTKIGIIVDKSNATKRLMDRYLPTRLTKDEE